MRMWLWLSDILGHLSDWLDIASEWADRAQYECVIRGSQRAWAQRIREERRAR